MNNRLYGGLPCVWDGEKFIVFSPFAQKVASLSEESLEKIQIKKKLEKLGFFKKSHSGDKKNRQTAKITLVLTTDCNLRCRYCYLGRRRKNSVYMDSKLAIRAIKQVIKPYTKKLLIHFFGGEPTLNIQTIKKVVSFVETLGVKHVYHITTNGCFSDRILNYLLKKNFVFTISMDGPPDIQNVQRPFLTGHPSSSWVEKTIRKLVAQKAYFNVRIVITKLNVKRLKEIIDYFASLRIKFVHFELMKPANRTTGGNILQPTIKTFLINFAKMLDRAEKYGIYVINSAFMNLLSPSCYFCTTVAGKKFVFTPDGTVTTCFEVQNFFSHFQDFIIGKYNPRKDLFEINKKKLYKMKKIQVDRYQKCRNCFAKYICGGGCPKRNLIETGSFNQVDPVMCKVKQKLIADAILRIHKNAKEKTHISIIFGTKAFEELVRWR